MKKLALISSVLLLMFLLNSCIIFLPSSDSIGNPQTFQKDGITLTLTDRFEEQESQMGFDAYYTSDFCGVMVLKEEFTLEEGLEDQSLSEYIESVIRNNGHTDIEPQSKEGLTYYIKDSQGLRYYSFCYKGSDAFWIVQFGCYQSDLSLMEEQIFFWARAVEIE